MTMQEMLSLGAPKLPEGHFYRVYERSFSGLWVGIYQERRFTSKRLVEVNRSRYNADYTELIPVPEYLRLCAETAYNKVFDKILTPDQEWWKIADGWKGDHK